jgi:glycosyltransferase involved in cell wall biosynthesis
VTSAVSAQPARTGPAATSRARTAEPVTICYPLAGDSLGGSHHSLLGLLRLLDRTRYRPLVVVEKSDGRLAEFFREFDQLTDPAPPRRSFEAGRSFGLGQFLTTLTGIRRRARLLRDHGAAIVHSNDGRSHATWSLAAKLAGSRLVWHHRGDPTARGLRMLAPWVADQIVTVSRFALPRSRRSRAARHARVVFSPFDTAITADRAAMRGRLVTELGLASDTLICGYFGLFVDRKRPLGFVEAVAELKAISDRPVAGVMFGEAEHRDIAEQLAECLSRPDLAGVVHVMGYRSPGWEWIAACDVLLVPAVDEPLGRTLVEAMLVGTPVIASDSGGNPEAILPGTGILVPPDQPGAMALACRNLSQRPERIAQITENAKKSAVERFTANRHVTEIEAIYYELLG